MSMEIHITLKGPMACGKTRATKAIEKALAENLPDKPYSVVWRHKLEDGTVTEDGVFVSGGR